MPREIRIANASIGFFANVRSFIQNVSQANQAVIRQQRAMRAYRSALRRTGRELRNLTSIAGQWVRQFTALAAAGGTGLGFGAAFQSLRTLDDEIVKLQTLIGLSTEQAETFRQKILEIAPALGAAPERLAEGLFFLVSTGFRGEKALNSLRVSAQLARLGFGTLRDSATLLTTAIGAFTKDALTADQAASILIATVKAGRFDAELLSTQLGRIGSVANELGISLDEVGASLAILSRIQDLPNATTGLRGILTVLIKPSIQAAEALEDVGLSVFQVRRALREDGFLQVMRDLVSRFREAGIDLSRLFRNVEGLNAILGIVGAEAEEVTQVFADLAKSAIDNGASLEEAWAIYTQSLSAQITQAIAKINTAIVELSSRIIPYFIDGLTYVSDNLAMFGQIALLTFGLLISRSFVARFIAVGIRVVATTLRMTLGISAIATAWTTVRTAQAAFVTSVAALPARVAAPLVVLRQAFRFTAQGIAVSTVASRSAFNIFVTGIASGAGFIRTQLLLTGVSAQTFSAILAASLVRARAGISAFLIASRSLLVNMRLLTVATGLFGRALAGPLAVGLVAARTAMGLLLVITRGVLLLLSRLVIPLALIEGLIFLIRFFGHLKTAVEDTAISFGEAAKVAIVLFVGRIAEELSKLPELFVRAFAAVIGAITVFVIEGGRLIGERFLDAILGRENETRFSTEFSRIFNNALDQASRGFRIEGIEPLFTQEQAAELFGFDLDELNKTRVVVGDALQKTIDEWLRIWGFAEDEDPVDINDIIDPNEAIRNLDDLVDAYAEANDEIKEKTEKTLTEIEKLNKQTVETMGRAVGEFAGDVIKNFNDLGDAARRLGQAIIDALVNRFIVEPITKVATGAFASIFGGILPFQAGGFLPAGRVGLVGEAGPELIVSGEGARILSNDNLIKGLQGLGERRGSPQVTVNLSVQSSDGPAVYRAINDSLPSLTEAVKTAVAADMIRPSGFAQIVR